MTICHALLQMAFAAVGTPLPCNVKSESKSKAEVDATLCWRPGGSAGAQRRQELEDAEKPGGHKEKCAERGAPLKPDGTANPKDTCVQWHVHMVLASWNVICGLGLTPSFSFITSMSRRCRRVRGGGCDAHRGRAARHGRVQR